MSAADNKEARVAELLKHMFFKCNTGQCIAQHLSARLAGSGRIVMVSQEDPPGTYTISIIEGSRVTRAPFDDRMVLFTHSDTLGVFGVAQLQPDVEQTNFANYRSTIDEHFDTIAQSRAALTIDSDSGTNVIPSIKLMAIEGAIVNRFDTAT